MKLSIAEAATVLGRSQRQVRYLIQTGRLAAKKRQGRWSIDSADLPLSDAERQALVERSQVARDAFEQGLEPLVKAARTAPEKPAGEAADAKRGYSVTDLRAFQAGAEIYRDVRRQLSPEDPAAGQLFEALALLTRGCHCYHPKEKASRFSEARELAATAVASLLLFGDEQADGRSKLARRIEQELIPKVAGLVASYEKRSRHGRFDRFGSAASRSR